MLWKRRRVLAHYHPKCQSGTSAPHWDSVCVPVGKICIIRIVFQSLKVIAKGFYMGEYLSSNWNRQSIYLLHVKYLQKCSLLCKHNFSVDPKIFSPINTCSEHFHISFPFVVLNQKVKVSTLDEEKIIQAYQNQVILRISLYVPFTSQ